MQTAYLHHQQQQHHQHHQQQQQHQLPREREKNPWTFRRLIEIVVRDCLFIRIFTNDINATTIRYYHPFMLPHPTPPLCASFSYAISPIYGFLSSTVLFVNHLLLTHPLGGLDCLVCIFFVLNNSVIANINSCGLPNRCFSI